MGHYVHVRSHVDVGRHRFTYPRSAARDLRLAVHVIDTHDRCVRVIHRGGRFDVLRVEGTCQPQITKVRGWRTHFCLLEVAALASVGSKVNSKTTAREARFLHMGYATMHDSDWDDLRFFLAVDAKGSISAAAQDLGTSHSTVLRRLTRLEEKLGARLFERLPSGYAMTAAGQQLSERLSGVAERIERAQRE